MGGRLRSLFRKPAGGEPVAAQPNPPEPAIATVRIFTAQGAREVDIQASDERVTDVLNASQTLRLRPAEASADPEEWAVVDLDEILIVIPPEHPTDRMRRLHRPGQAIVIKLGPYTVAGASHVPAGSDAAAFLLRHRLHFVPITQATITHADGSSAFTEPVVIVNLWRVESLRTP
jgi:hypothetical protein